MNIMILTGLLLCQTDNCPTLSPQAPIIPYINRVNQSHPTMRKIEEQMINAINEEKDWRNDNTSVRVIHEGILYTPSYNKRIEVRLFDNLIATIHDTGRMTISSCGWRRPTTKSRLNALLREYANTGIYHKNRVWYMGDNEEFYDNMTVPVRY